jgi:hypothetical protein
MVAASSRVARALVMRAAGFEFPVDDRPAAVGDGVQLGHQLFRIGHGQRRIGAQVRPVHALLALGLGQGRQQHAPHGGMEGRQARADAERDRDRLAAAGARDMHDLVPIEQPGRAGNPEPARDILQGRLDRLPHRHRREKGVTQLQDARAQRIEAAFQADISQLDQGMEKAADGGARQAGALGDVTHAQLRGVDAEGADDRQATRQRMDEIGIGICLWHGSSLR